MKEETDEGKQKMLYPISTRQKPAINWLLCANGKGFHSWVNPGQMTGSVDKGVRLRQQWKHNTRVKALM